MLTGPLVVIPNTAAALRQPAGCRVTAEPRRNPQWRIAAFPITGTVQPTEHSRRRRHPSHRRRTRRPPQRPPPRPLLRSSDSGERGLSRMSPTTPSFGKRSVRRATSAGYDATRPSASGCTSIRPAFTGKQCALRWNAFCDSRRSSPGGAPPSACTRRCAAPRSIFRLHNASRPPWAADAWQRRSDDGWFAAGPANRHFDRASIRMAH